jgi:hypothetical protein
MDSQEDSTMPRWTLLISAAVLAYSLGDANLAHAQYGPQTAPLDRMNYYPYYYFPANYWPTQGPKWPESAGQPYMPPPAYQAYPAFQEPNWRYEMNTPHKYYRGFHFWLDQF